jgi:hypothetical protein
MSEVIVKYKNADYTVFLQKLSRKQRIMRKNIDVNDEGKLSLNVELIAYKNVEMSIAKVIGTKTGEDLLNSISKDEFLDGISDEDYNKLVEGAEKDNPFQK